jgi:putative ATP-dependent endonuclease of the OLD family
MKIKNITIKNFRSIAECDFCFNDLLALVGENNNGKSNIIDAIEMLLKNNKVNNEYDFKDKTKTIEIEATFDELTDSEKEKIGAYLDDDSPLRLKKDFVFVEKDNGLPDSKSTLYYFKEDEWKKTPAQNPFSGGILPEFYKVPAVRELKEETKIATTTYFGKFLDLLFDSDDYDFANLDNILDQINTELKREDENAPLIKGAKEIEAIMCEQFKDCYLKFEIDTPKRKSLISQMEIFADDGCHTPLSSKGHGTQRAFIFSILLLYAQKLNNKLKNTDGKDKKDIIIAIEEPEVYLHPHQQRIIYKLFKKLIGTEAEQIQIIYTTHSSFMINIEDYKYLGLVTKNSVGEGTKVTQCIEDIFESDDKKEFKMACQFDPERNELFFADKIILCEGDTEKYSLPIIFEKLGINLIDKRISVIECGSKNSIPLFQKVLNKFNEKEKKFNYYVFYDNDNGNGKNQEIDNLMDNVNNRFVFQNDLESHFFLTGLNKDKAYTARKQLLGKSESDFPEDIKTFIQNNFS